MIGTIVNYIKVQRVLNKIFTHEKIEKNLTQTFGVECKRDWVGRLYMVINPILQNIQSDGNEMIFDKDNNAQIEAWVMKNLELIRHFVVNNSMFDILSYSIERLDDDENYLVVFKNIYFDDVKRIVKWTIGIIITALIGWGIYGIVK